LNNYVAARFEEILSINCKYVVIGKEVGESGTPHLQGYIYFEQPKSMKQLKELIVGAHLEISKGTAAQNRVYCTKDGNFEERGVIPASQEEKGLKGKEKLKEMWTLAVEGQFLELPPQNIRVWEYIHQKYQAPPVDLSVLNNQWIFGPTGSGKSSLIRSLKIPFYPKPMSKWWDGYSGEEVVVLDDFAPEHGKFLGYFLKIWADHYAFNAEVKGGMLKIRPKYLLITSQYRLSDCFEENQTVQALARRFREWNMDEKLGIDFVLDPAHITSAVVDDDDISVL